MNSYCGIKCPNCVVEKTVEKGWTGMVHLPEGDVREARNRAKFPRWGN